MPESAIRAGVVDYVRPAGSMVEQIRAFMAGAAGREAHGLPGDSSALGRIFVAVRDRPGHDFSVHKASTSRRRIERRMNVHHIETVEEYLRYLQIHPPEIDALFREMLIGVTSFLRDPEAFDALAAKGLPTLLDSRPDGTEVRVWVPGCSTGEEAYSLAILLREYLDAQKRSLQIQIFATDLDGVAIERARAGVYPDGIASDLTAGRLQRWFVHEDSHYRVKKEIRDLVIFAPHDLLTDPPFTRLDLLSCRNLLIYLESRAQRNLIPLFHYALKPAGLLFLGASESIERHDDLFSVVDRRWKIFRKLNAGRQVLQGFPIGRGTTRPADAPPVAQRPESRVLATTVEGMLLARSVQSGVVVDKRGEVFYVAGQPDRVRPGSPPLRHRAEGDRSPPHGRRAGGVAVPGLPDAGDPEPGGDVVPDARAAVPHRGELDRRRHPHVLRRHRHQAGGGEAQAYFESIVQTVRGPLVVLDQELRVVSANGAFYRAFGLTPADTERRVIYGLGSGAWDIPRLRELLESILPANSQFERFQIDHVFPGVGRKVIVLNARRLERQMGLPGLILLAMEETG